MIFNPVKKDEVSFSSNVNNEQLFTTSFFTTYTTAFSTQENILGITFVYRLTGIDNFGTISINDLNVEFIDYLDRTTVRLIKEDNIYKFQVKRNGPGTGGQFNAKWLYP